MPALKPSLRLGKKKHRYLFTVEEAWLVCGGALLQPARPGVPPTLSLSWKSGKKTAYGGAVRAGAAADGRAAEWREPVSLACSVYSSTSHGQMRLEPRNSDLTVRVEGGAAKAKKISGSLDLAPHASYSRQSTTLSVPLAKGAATLHLQLTSAWLKRGLGGGDDSDGASSSAASESSIGSSVASSAMYGDEDGLSERGLSERGADSDDSAASERTRTGSAARAAIRAASFAAGRRRKCGDADSARAGEQHHLGGGGEAGGEAADALSRAAAAFSAGGGGAGGGGGGGSGGLLRLGRQVGAEETAGGGGEACAVSALLGMDCEDGRFGRLLCSRLGYQRVSAGRWEGSEESGLEREVGTLDIPYGESFRVQERWVALASAAGGGGDGGVQLRAALMASKIRSHALKKSRKAATAAAELLARVASAEEEEEQPPPPAPPGAAFTAGAGGSGLGGAGGGRGAELQEQYDALFEEASYLKRRCAQLERENARLEHGRRHTSKDKRQLLEKVTELEAALVAERRKRADMEEALATAYNATLRELVEAGAGRPNGAGASRAAAAKPTRPLKGTQRLRALASSPPP
ncbi:hypothetical protein EMIHUDRAFT_97664 [Emiliania huxleyi CCMP1516]|uniref:C2 NT-type domain-containing protein n=2 Tax=Emiliania huxleyi TaxID=2903 RepID=A0A0D3KUK4_EMIH1|nr:hypothetical protein EMIHUDRAFT_97664 [Emiliania huxleyi CCMP1516]EOD39439.1 hypothetical protein EMIHUDRAFT_97664 [Emiliania huxleyi CCMP1516]|eukprot:XP_005791868.1 hypothetical protein EMIHUDRAFT_97664 [Emiliania huxleyi CCMP1516]